MKLRNDDRGVSEVIGAILVFGILIALLSILQTQAIPIANEKVEFNHNAEVQSDMVEFHEASTKVGATGASQSTTVQMGTTYPSRLLFFNPKNPTGTIRVAGNQTGSIENVKAVDDNVNDYIDGTRPVDDLWMKRIVYKPRYNEYQNSPRTVVEYGAVYNDFGNRTLFENPPQVISGSTISLTFYNGSMSLSKGGATSLEAQATSAPSRTVTVQSAGSGPIVLLLPTNLDAETWNEAIGAEKNVENVQSAGPNMVRIELDSTTTYSLKMAQIGIGSGVPSTDAEYITRASDEQLRIASDNTLPIEVRDRYNNPVGGVPINLTVDTGLFQNGKRKIQTVTTEDGRPAATYQTGNAGFVEVNASFARDPNSKAFADDKKEDIRTTLTVSPGADSISPSFITSPDVDRSEFTVCGNFSVSLLNCVSTPTISQIIVDYSVKDDGGAGLDYMEIAIVNSSGGVQLNATQALRGSQSSGTYRSAQINHDLAGPPDRVDIRIFDRAGNLLERTNINV